MFGALKFGEMMIAESVIGEMVDCSGNLIELCLDKFTDVFVRTFHVRLSWDFSTVLYITRL